MVKNQQAAQIANEGEEIEQAILQNIQDLLSRLNISKIYFIDDAINQDTGKATFKGLIEGIIADGKLDELKAINLTGIDFTQDGAVLLDHIDEVWDNVKHSKQLRYFEKAYTITGKPEAIRDLNVSNNLKDFFAEAQIEFLTPNEWDEKVDEILGGIADGNRLMVIFDQDLKLAQGRYADNGVQGEQLILELKQKNLSDKLVVALLTHTVTDYEGELPKRAEICNRIEGLNVSDFFVLAKVRLEKHALFGDGIKKVCLNTYCEDVKSKTIEIIQKAQKETIAQLKTFDTYDFDHTVFKSSLGEGVWEPDTLLRITDIIFKDKIRALMISGDYVPTVNTSICSAKEISKIEFPIEDTVNPYKERFKLRHQEIYEKEVLLNKLRRPIDNGDIFLVTDGEKVKRKYILVAQECDLMVRGGQIDKGTRGSRIATLLEIETFTSENLFKDIERKYLKDIEKKAFQSHYYADKFKLEYFEEGTNKVGIVHFSKAKTIDLNVLDLIVFNEAGEAKIDLNNPSYNADYHNFAWQSRFEIVKDEFTAKAELLTKQLAVIDATEDGDVKNSLKLSISHLLSFVDKLGIQINFSQNVFDFGLKRVSRVRLPKSKYILDRYYSHLARIAELHDFAHQHSV